MNAVYNLLSRGWRGARFGKETLAGGGLNNKQFNDFVPDDPPLAARCSGRRTLSFSPRVLKDGSDSVGALGALNRVYLNIGLFSEEWLLHFNPLVGGKRSRLSRSRSRKELRLLAGDRSANSRHGVVFPQEHGAPQTQGCAGRRGAI